MLKWLKVVLGGKVALIKLMDELEGPFADYLTSLKGKATSVDAHTMAKGIVDKAQRKLCEWLKVDPTSVGLQGNEGL